MVSIRCRARRLCAFLSGAASILITLLRHVQVARSDKKGSGGPSVRQDYSLSEADGISTSEVLVGTGPHLKPQSNQNNVTNRKFVERFLSKLTVNEWLTLLIGIASLAVAYLGYRNSADNTDFRNAITQLSTLAVDTKREADAVSGQLEIIKNQQRPMVFASQIGLASHPVYDVNGLSISLLFKLQNVGHEPGVSASVNISVFSHAPSNLTKYAAFVKPVCDSDSEYIGETIFPGEDNPPSEISVSYTYNDIASEVKSYPNVPFINPVIVACVVYRDAFENVHHTPYILNMFVVKNGVAGFSIPRKPEDLAASQVVLQKEILGGLAPD